MNGSKPEDIKTYEDLEKIQPIPSDAFKDSENLILSIPEEEIGQILKTSSTTSSNPGRHSFSKRDGSQMAKLNGALLSNVLDFPENPGSAFFLAPRPSESETGLVKGGLITFRTIGFNEEDIYFAVRDGKIDAETIVNEIKEAKKPAVMYGPPFAYLPFIELWKKLGENKPLVSLSNDSRLITTGGWKSFKPGLTKEEFREQLSKTFDIEPSQIRDGYGATEIITMFPECSHGKKHVPFWNHISIRDPEDTNKELEPGKEGLIVLMASWIEGFPSFCMPGDKGIVKEGVCECGRVGQTVEVTGRAEDAGARGCALRIKEFMDSKNQDNSGF